MLLTATLAPFLASLVPGRAVPEVVWHFMNESSEGSSFPLVRLVATILVLLLLDSALTVLFIPIVTAVVRVAEPAEALEQLVMRHEDPRAILHEHRLAFMEHQEQFRRRLIQAHERGERMDAAEYLTRGGYRALVTQFRPAQDDVAAMPERPPTRPGDATRPDPPLWGRRHSCGNPPGPGAP